MNTMLMPMLTVGIAFGLCATGVVVINEKGKRIKRMEQQIVDYRLRLKDCKKKLTTEKMRCDYIQSLREQDVKDYNELVGKYNNLARMYRMSNGKTKGSAFETPVVKEMLRYATTQAHPDAGKEKTPDRFIKYREEFEKLYKGGR